MADIPATEIKIPEISAKPKPTVEKVKEVPADEQLSPDALEGKPKEVLEKLAGSDRIVEEQNTVKEGEKSTEEDILLVFGQGPVVDAATREKSSDNETPSGEDDVNFWSKG